MTRALVVGYGSIGVRHAECLVKLGCEVGIVTSRADATGTVFRRLPEAVERLAPDYCVIATATARHAEALQELQSTGFVGKVLVEKPLYERTLSRPLAFARTVVGYNLRLHPLVRWFRDLCQSERIISVHGYVGQFLPDWRLARDYRECSSARQTEGGGVLRDLSHELDYLNWILGGWMSVAAVQGRFGPLEIETDDTCAVLFQFKHCPAVTLQMNYLDRASRRELIVNTNQGTVVIDLVNGFWQRNREPKRELAIARSETYLAMHRAVLENRWSELCSAEEGMEIVRLIEAMEQSSRERKWITR